MHQAALLSVPESIKAPVASSDVNIGGTVKLLSAALKAGVRRVVMASSASIYGDTKILPITEDMAPQPMSPYAVTKLTGEHYMRVFAELHGMETMSLRYFNVFGPRQDPNSQYSGVIARFIKVALEGSCYTVYGDGLQTRDFTYIDNVVAANLLALRSDAAYGEAINAACGDCISLLDMIKILNKIVGKDIPIKFLEARTGDIKHSQAKIEMAKKLLGFAPIVDFATGLGRTFAWYRENL